MCVLQAYVHQSCVSSLCFLVLTTDSDGSVELRNVSLLLEATLCFRGC